MTPPTAIRRPLTITTWLVLSSVCLVLSPLILLAGAAAAALLGRPQAKLVARLLIEYFARELLVLIACGGLWLLSGCGWQLRSPRFRALHFRLLRWFVCGLSARVRDLLEIDVSPDPSPEAARALAADRPLLYFSRHAGPGDTLILADLLMSRYDRLPSVVFKDALTIDPCVDLLGHRLPHAALNLADAEECEKRIAEVTARLGPRGALLLFPEGANITAQRRTSAIDKLRRKGKRREAAAGREMEHVLPPHPTGAQVALRSRPDTDVIFSGHTGLGLAAFPRELWRDPPIGRTLKMRMWLAPAAERPADPDEQAKWLYDWWGRIDTWLEQEGEPRP